MTNKIDIAHKEIRIAMINMLHMFKNVGKNRSMRNEIYKKPQVKLLEMKNYSR